MVLFVGLALAGRDLLNNCSCRQNGAKVLGVNLVKRLQIFQVVEINVRGDDLIEMHIGLLQVIEEIAHRLPKLMLGRRGIDTTVGPRDEATLGGAKQSVAGKNAGTRGWAGGHIFWTDGPPLLKIAHRNARVLDVSAAGEAR